MAFNLMERDYSLHGQIDQPFSLYKSHIKSPYMELSRPNNHTFSLSNFQSKGLLKAPPPLSLLHSAPPPQPPLLPLPASLPRRSISCPPPAIKIGTRNHVKKKSTKSMNSIPKKEEKIRSPPKKSSVTVAVVSSTRNVGPELQPKNIARVAHFDNPIPVKDMTVAFTISPPPPSSLPLPTFSLRPKLSCNAAAAAGIDAGATDDLRRILRLQ